MTEQTKEVFRMRMKQYQERNEMVERQKQQREWRMMEMKQRMNSIVNNLDPVKNDMDTVKTESRCGIFSCHFLISTTLCISRCVLLKEAECPVCLQEMTGRIWQCESGHLLCETCHNRPEVATCPTCRAQFMGRATAVEQIVKTIRNVYK